MEGQDNRKRPKVVIECEEDATISVRLYASGEIRIVFAEGGFLRPRTFLDAVYGLNHGGRLERGNVCIQADVVPDTDRPEDASLAARPGDASVLVTLTVSCRRSDGDVTTKILDAPVIQEILERIDQVKPLRHTYETIGKSIYRRQAETKPEPHSRNDRVAGAADTADLKPAATAAAHEDFDDGDDPPVSATPPDDQTPNP